MYCLHLSELVLLLLGVDTNSSSTQMTVAWFIGCTCTPVYQHLWLSLERIVGHFHVSF